MKKITKNYLILILFLGSLTAFSIIHFNKKTEMSRDIASTAITLSCGKMINASARAFKEKFREPLRFAQWKRFKKHLYGSSDLVSSNDVEAIKRQLNRVKDEMLESIDYYNELKVMSKDKIAIVFDSVEDHESMLNSYRVKITSIFDKGNFDETLLEVDKLIDELDARLVEADGQKFFFKGNMEIDRWHRVLSYTEFPTSMTSDLFGPKNLFLMSPVYMLPAVSFLADGGVTLALIVGAKLFAIFKAMDFSLDLAMDAAAKLYKQYEVLFASVGSSLPEVAHMLKTMTAGAGLGSDSVNMLIYGMFGALGAKDMMIAKGIMQKGEKLTWDLYKRAFREFTKKDILAATMRGAMFVGAAESWRFFVAPAIRANRPEAFVPWFIGVNAMCLLFYKQTEKLALDKLTRQLGAYDISRIKRMQSTIGRSTSSEQTSGEKSLGKILTLAEGIKKSNDIDPKEIRREFNRFKKEIFKSKKFQAEIRKALSSSNPDDIELLLKIAGAELDGVKLKSVEGMIALGSIVAGGVAFYMLAEQLDVSSQELLVVFEDANMDEIGATAVAVFSSIPEGLIVQKFMAQGRVLASITSIAASNATDTFVASWVVLENAYQSKKRADAE